MKRNPPKQSTAERLRGVLEIAALVLYLGSIVIALGVLIWLDAR